MRCVRGHGERFGRRPRVLVEVVDDGRGLELAYERRAEQAVEQMSEQGERYGAPATTGLYELELDSRVARVPAVADADVAHHVPYAPLTRFRLFDHEVESVVVRRVVVLVGVAPAELLNPMVDVEVVDVGRVHRGHR